MADTAKPQKVIVVGAGPVGALAALYAAKRGDDVEIYELRGDLRDPNVTLLNFTRSINLALSERGINSLREAHYEGLAEDILADTTPMYGRMIHGRTNSGELYQQSQQYDVFGRYINAVDRAGLNKKILDALEKMPNVKFFFNHKLTGADFAKSLAWFERKSVPRTDHAQNPTHTEKPPKEEENRDPEIEIKFDFMIGADGAHSAVRYHLMKFERLNYQQEYVDTLWCELDIKPNPTTGDFAISPNHLHIWPGRDFMFIALPNRDKTFTCTLFAPHSTFTHLDTSPEKNVVPFFAEKFPGVCPELMSPADLILQYTTNPHWPLISIKCTPYHHSSSVVILGDAAHAMVPFYGQGMNAGLEDVRVLFDFLDSHGVYPQSPRAIAHPSTGPKDRRAAALAAYTTHRTPDAHTINDLALQNYYEMRQGVTSPLYRLRKTIEELANMYFPALGFRTQYSRVSFGNERYSGVKGAVERQKVLLEVFLGVVLGVGVLGGVGIWRKIGRRGVERGLRGFVERMMGRPRWI
ncbi:MAG: kynurenine 3-monooxygenase, mitochondrial precursor [Icmadophila ericetorum]|nr:kynurenine 3-monooxygenase, mitochondrial precursor [Icmadophila ericetorum]